MIYPTPALRSLLVLFFVLPTGEAAADDTLIVGTGKAKDGDSLMVDRTEVRLFGIDAPEFAQICFRNNEPWTCGEAAAEQLSSIIDGKSIRCSSMGTDQHGRQLGRCTTGTLDINRTMVATGYAVAFRRYSSDYVSAEASAKANKRGIWSSSFQMPSEYRHTDAPAIAKPKRQSSVKIVSAPRASTASRGCVIKGNRNRRGQWIYHLPGMPYYDQTRAEEIFCTEAEARAAGYRRAVVK